MNSQLTLTAACDRRLVAVEVSSQRTIEWVITANSAAKQTERAPLNVALILDRSGSMSGEKLRYVQQAASHVLDQLDGRDRVALVAYDETVQLLAASTLITAASRAELKAKIEALRPGGSTDLGGGWLEGCREVAAHLSETSVSRALLLTDGLANCGITDVEELGRHARELRRRGVATSTFGVGLDFNESLLELLAEQGGGRFYFIERPGQIPEVFRRELGELLEVVAREASLRITIPTGVALEVLGELPHERGDGQVRVFLGDLSSGEQRAVYTRILTPPDTVGTQVALRGELGYATMEGQAARTHAEIGFNYAREAEVRLMPVANDLLGRAGEVELAATAKQALRLERSGQRAQAQSLLHAALAANAPTMAAPTAAAYNSLADQLGQGMDEASRKRAHFDSYQARQARKK